MVTEESLGQCLSPFVTPLVQRRLVIVTVDRKALSATVVHSAAKEGFEADAIEASLNTIEFSLREFNTGGFPKGLWVELNYLFMCI